MYSKFVDIHVSHVFLVVKCFNKLVCVLTYLQALSFFWLKHFLLAKIESLNLKNLSHNPNLEGRVLVS